MELLARAQADNPLEVYYDVLDALHSSNDDDVCHALLCLQAGSKLLGGVVLLRCLSTPPCPA